MAYYINNIPTSYSKNGIQVPSNANPTFKLLKRIIVWLLLLVVVGSVNGATNTWTNGNGNNNWNTANNWSRSAVPINTDDVVIPNGNNVTVNTSAVCASLTISTGGSSNNITISGSNSLAVTGVVSIATGSGSGDNKKIAVGAGTLSCGSITVAATTNSNRSSGITISTGTISVGGNITMGDINDDFTFTGAGTLNVGGNMSGGTFTCSTGTVNYNGGAQNIGAYTYYNLTFSGSGAKTNTGITVNGVLSMEGDGTVTASAAPAYGGSATLQYNTATSQTAGNEWIASFAGSGGIIIANTGTITMNSAEVVNAPITINSGATLATNNYQLTFGGNFVNNGGTFIAGSSPIVIGGTATQSIDGFTTTGLVSMIKTSHIATLTGNVNGAGLTINGLGGTLNLGSGLTHTFTGTWIQTVGTLNGGSSTLKLGNGVTNSGGTFTAGSGTVEYYASGSQTIVPFTYNNLTISGTGTNSKTAGGNITVNGILNLSSANYSTTQGCLDMGSYTLNMGTTATTIGTGDVTGIVTRTFTFATNKSYSFGNQFTTMTLAAGGILPSSISVKIVLTSSNITWKTDAIHRYYDIIQTGGNAATKVTLSLHYLDGELNGATENKLSLFDDHVSIPRIDDHGQSNFDLTNNWVALANLSLTYIAPAVSFGTKYWTLGSSTTLNDCTWSGNALSTDWNDAGNWTGGIPVSTSDVFIPNVGSNPVPALISTTIGSLTIFSGGTLNATTGSPTLTIVEGSGAWENMGTFNPGTTSSIIFTNASATMAGITNFFNVTVADGATMTLGINNIMRIAGTLSLSSTGVLDASNDNNLVEYNGTSQTVVSPNGVTSGYHDLTLSGSGTKTMPTSTMMVYGNLAMGGTASATAGAALTVTGNVTLDTGTTFNASSFTHNVGGNWTNNGAFTPGTGTVTMNGDAQTIAGTSATTFYNLTFSGTGTKTVGSAITTNGDLTVNNGITLSMSTYLLTLNANLINNGTVSGTTGGVTIAGTATQSIDPFTTTGTVSMLKTAGTATLTGNINGAGLTVNGTGGTLNLGTGTGHTFTSAIITAGTLIMGAANALPNTLPFNLGGGTLSTGYTETVGTLNVTANSTIALGTGSHILNFAASNSVGWTSGTWLTITGWTGGYNGTSGTAGEIFVGTTGSGITGSQQSQILFYNGTNYHTATQLSTGEVVPTSTVFTPTLTYTTPNTFVTGTAIAPLVPTINVTPTGYSVSPTLPSGLGFNTSTGVISGTPIGNSGPSNYTVTATTAAGNAIFAINITTRVFDTYYSRATGSWNTNTTWSLSSGGGAVGSGIYPLAGDIVVIEGGHNVTVTADAACSTINFNATAATSLTINSGFDLNVSGVITIPRPGSGVNLIAVGAGNLNAGSIAFTSGGTSVRHEITISTGTVTVLGNVTTDNTGTSATIAFSSVGTLTLGGSLLATPSNGGTLTTVAGSTVIYNALGAQTVEPFIYYNLTLTGSGAKTTTGATVNGILSMEGTATTTGIVAVYGGSATLQYKGSGSQTTGLEFPAPFSGTGGVIINNGNGVTLNAAKTISSSLTLTNGIFTTTSTNLLSITNTANSAISGGSATTFINGPVKWTLPTSLASGSTYTFPVGKGSTYLPFSLVNPTTGSATTPTAQVEAFAIGSGGSAGTGVSAISSNEYWKLITSGSYTNSSVSIVRPTAISPSTVVATSISTVNSTYSNLGGTFDTYGVYSSNATTNAATQYFVFATGNVASMNVTTNSLYGFSYSVGNGPSNELSFKESGISLTGSIIVTPPSINYEISTVSGGIFQTTPITLTPVSGQVSATIYVREVAGLSVGNYVSTITIASSNSQFTTQSVNCYGTVVPVITVGGGGSYCVGDPINLTSSGVTNQYWTGPNNYYSILQSPIITSSTTAMTGTYTVTGSITSGINLVVDGNFESGGVSNFTTSYTRNTSSLTTEGTYNVIKSPYSEHTGFCACGDHTTGTGYQMVVNGAPAIQIIWQPTSAITVTPYTNYQFSYYVQTVDVNDIGLFQSPSQTQLFVNSIAAGPIYTANDTTGIWKQFKYNWYSGTNTTANLVLKNEDTATGGNDFALDDLVFQQVYTSSASVNVTVLSPGTPPSVSVTASANPVNSGTNVTFTANPTNGGTAPTYQWSVNGTPVTGATAVTYTYIPNNGDVVSCTMTSNTNCLSGGSYTVSSSVNMVVNTVLNYWYGAATTDWGTASNWTAGYVPGNGDNVEFATTTNNSGSQAVNNLILDVDRTIGNLTNATNPIQQLIIPPARCLTVNGSIIIPDNDPSRNYIQAAPDGSEQNGSLIFPNATNVYGTVEMFAKGSYDATGIIDSGTGITYHYTWQYFGIPVSSVTASPTFDGSYVRSYNEGSSVINGKWTQLTNSSVLSSFKGYEITQNTPKTIQFQGLLENGDSTISLPYSSGASVYDPGQNIISNSYTAAIDIRQLTFGGNTEKTIYLYNTGSFGQWANSNNNGEGTYNTDPSLSMPGQYLAIPFLSAGTGTPPHNIPYDIPSMSGFLVKATTSGVSGSITINYSSVTKNVNAQRTISQVNQTSDKVYMEISLKGKNTGDCMWLINQPGTTHGFDNGWDGYKMTGDAGTPQLFAMEESGNYQVSTSDDMSNTYLGFQAGIDLEDTLTFYNENLTTRYAGVYLVDLTKNNVIDITKSGTQYSFIAESTPTPVKRFMIITRSSDEATTDTELKLFSSGNIVFVQNFGNLNGEIVVYDVMGHLLKRATFGPYGITAVQVGTITGAYIVKASTSNEKVSEKIIIGK
jgi:hypothetical protein